jgi:hypothetical protein
VGKLLRILHQLESEEALDKFLASYPTAFAILNKTIKTSQWMARELPDRVQYSDADRIKDKAREVEGIRQNQRLVAYYKTYGFKVVPGRDQGDRTPMKGTVGGILSACGRKPTGGKKTRRRQRTRRHK